MAKEHTPWDVFIWAAGIVTLSVIGLFGLWMSVSKDVSDLKTDVALVRQDVSYIKAAIPKIAPLANKQE